MEPSSSSADSTPQLPDYVPVPEGAFGPALNEQGYLDEVTARAAAPVIAKYTGLLAAADVPAFTTSTTFSILQSIRLDLGTGSQVHP